MRKHIRRECPPPVNSIRELIDGAAGRGGEKTAYRYKAGGEVKDVSFGQFRVFTDNIGAALAEMGLDRAHIACIGRNSFEYIAAYLTVLGGNGTFVPIDKELTPEEKLHLLSDSDSEAVFCDEKNIGTVLENSDKLPGIKYVFSLEPECDSAETIYSLAERGKDLPRRKFDYRPDKTKLLIYTSGTTGIAKGVMLTEHNLVSSVCCGLEVSQIYDCGLSVLPYHHAYEAVCDILVSLHFGSTLCISESLKNVVQEMQFYKPSYIYLVPAFADVFYAAIRRQIRKSGKEKKFGTAVLLSDSMRKVGIDLRPKLFAEIQKNFGGRLKKIVCGGAPIRPEVGRFFDTVGLTLVGGYGITECSPLVCVNDELTRNDFDTCGTRLRCIEWKIDSPDSDGAGEVLVKGDVVMKGYYKQPEKTAEVFTEDGFFRTGDYGIIPPDDRLIITGRKKNIVVMSNGKNVYPEEIEKYIARIEYVSECVVRGIKNSRGDEVGLEAEIYCPERTDEEKVLADVQEMLSCLPAYKNVSRVILRDSPFEKTTSNKIKRQ